MNAEAAGLAVADVCTLDIEASGFGRGSYPIEVGLVRSDGSSFCTLIQPAAGWTHWDPGAEQVHGITRDLLLRHGRPVAAVAMILNEQLHGETVYSDGWAYDYPWLARLFDEADRALHFRLEPIAKLLSEERLQHYGRARDEALASLGVTRHRASNDARALQHALRRLRST
jgi:hypothetical protein